MNEKLKIILPFMALVFAIMIIGAVFWALPALVAAR